MNDDDRAERTLRVAEHVSKRAAELGFRVAVIGGVALAVHGYPRATVDLDLASDTDPFTKLKALESHLGREGYQTRLFLPDNEDPLGGVLTVLGGDFDPVQVVNYYNPLAPSRNPGRDSIENAHCFLVGSSLSVVDLSHLVALKLYAGGPKNNNDVIELLDRNPSASRDDIRATCARFDLDRNLSAILDEIDESPKSP